jgi:hypothetical protein
MVTCKLRRAKGEHHLSFTFGLAGHCPYSVKCCRASIRRAIDRLAAGDEPGAMAALIDLKLSQNAQFQDRPGACKLIETAVSRRNRSLMPRLAVCPAN